MSLVDDTDAWRRALDGEGAAFGVLFDRHRPRVQRHLARLLDSREDAEDALAIVFLEAWRRRDAVRVVDGSVLPWLLTTANNVRRSARRYRALLDQLPDATPEVEPQYEADVVTALRNLSLADQQVLTLCVLEEWSKRDAAQALHVRPGTVKSRLHRAKKRLSDQFQKLTPANFEGRRHDG